MARQRPNIHLMSDEKELLPAGVLREKLRMQRLLRFTTVIEK